MERRAFVKNTTLCAVAISTCGYIRLEGDRYVGDCETTTDILGPFYRPDSPVRSNLVTGAETGIPVELSGVIHHNDCKTPYSKAKIELWHCSPAGQYDNTSPDYRYRGTSYSDAKGRYAFQTVLPVPYADGSGATRPAHFHLMITAAGYQPFVTQLYFTGDKYLTKDPYSAAPTAQRRILEVQGLPDGRKKVAYDVSMSPKLVAETAVIDRLTGLYKAENNSNYTIELFKRNNMLWMKNEVFGHEFEYIGNNTFEYTHQPLPMSWTLHFEILPQRGIRVTEINIDEKGHKEVHTALRTGA